MLIRYTLFGLFLINLLACQNSGQSSEEKLQGQWHGHFVAHKGEWNQFANFDFVNDTVIVSSIPDSTNYGNLFSSYNIDTFFKDFTVQITKDSVYYWSNKDESFSFDCNFCGRLAKGRLPNFAEYYLSLVPVKPFSLPIVNVEGTNKPIVSNISSHHDSVPIFITQHTVIGSDGTTKMLPQVWMQYGATVYSDLKEISNTVAQMQMGHGQSYPYLFFFIDEAVTMEAIDAVVFSLPVNARKHLMYLLNEGSPEFSMVSANQIATLAIVQDYYQANLPYFNTYDSLVPLAPYTFGPQKHAIFYGNRKIASDNPIDVFLTVDQLFIGSAPIDVSKLGNAVEPMLRINGGISLGFEGNVTYGRFLEVYAILKGLKDNEGYSTWVDYYSLDVYRSLKPEFSIEQY